MLLDLQRHEDLPVFLAPAMSEAGLSAACGGLSLCERQNELIILKAALFEIEEKSMCFW